MFGRRKDNAPVPVNNAQPDSQMDRIATSIAQQLINVGINGVANFDSAASVADKALKQEKTPAAAIDHIVNSHTRLAGMSGFVTNLGGFVTMPVALPANVVGFYTLATRMVAAIARINGHDITSPAVRSAVLLHLVGADATKILKGVGSPATIATRVTTAGLPPAALAVVNKAVAFRLASSTGQRFLTKIPRAIPVAGGVIGAFVDVSLIRGIAKDAKAGFAPSPSQKGPHPDAA